MPVAATCVFLALCFLIAWQSDSPYHLLPKRLSLLTHPGPSVQTSLTQKSKCEVSMCSTMKPPKKSVCRVIWDVESHATPTPNSCQMGDLFLLVCTSNLTVTESEATICTQVCVSANLGLGLREGEMFPQAPVPRRCAGPQHWHYRPVQTCRNHRCFSGKLVGPHRDTCPQELEAQRG